MLLRNGRLRDLIIYCDRPSNAVNTLVEKLGCRRVVAAPRRRVVRTDGSLCINYGTSRLPVWSVGNKSIVLNDPEKVKQSISKVKSYERFKEAGVPTLEFTTKRDEAAGWLATGSRTLARRDGLSSGQGIHIIEPGGTLPTEHTSDFYAKYFPKTHEYRVHVFKAANAGPASQGGSGLREGAIRGGIRPEGVDSYRVIDITQKKRTVDGSSDESEGSSRTLHQRVVRSLDNGWVHAHGGVHLPGDTANVLGTAAIQAVRALGLDFGAVDILAKYSKKNPAKLLAFAVAEVNTAPGLANEVTVEAYVNAIKELYQASAADRKVAVRRRVRKLVPVTFVSRKGNRITRERMRWVYEET